MDSSSYKQMVEIGNKVMDTQGHKEVDEANKATLRSTGVTPKMRQVLDTRARSDLYDPYAIRVSMSKYVV